MNPLTFIFFGPSGSGKGTQAKLLIDFLNRKDSDRKVLFLETGEKFREFVSGQTLAAKRAKDIIESGGLMPEFLPIWIWAKFMINNITGNEHLILDGLSRRKEEAPILDSAMKFYKRENPFVISIEVSHEWATDKLLRRGRADDNEEDIKNRLDWYDQNVLPAINFFRNNPYYRFLSINGEQTIEGVHKEILEKAQL